MTVNGIGDYTGTKTATFNIVNTIDVAKANIALAVTSTPFVGAALTPAATVSYDGRILPRPPPTTRSPTLITSMPARLRHRHRYR